MIDNRILPRYTSSSENWSMIVDRVCSIYTNSNSIRKLILDGSFIPGGQILRGAGYNNKILYNSYVTSIDANESELAVANRITNWTNLGIGVGVNVSEWIKNHRYSEINSLNIITTAICKSQQKLWENGITRTATMINIDFGIEGTSELSIKLVIMI